MYWVCQNVPMFPSAAFAPGYAPSWLSTERTLIAGCCTAVALRNVAVYVAGTVGAVITCDCPPPSDHDW